MRKLEVRVCEYCATSFHTLKSDVKRGGGKYCSQECSQKSRKGIKRPPFSEAWKNNLSQSMKGRVPWNKGKTGVYSKETLEKMSKSKIGSNMPPRTISHRRNISESKKKLWQDPSFASKMIKTFHTKPSKPEKTLTCLIKQNNLPFKYVGDGAITIGGLCPDFISTDETNRIIEIFGEPFHDPFKGFPLKHHWMNWKQSYWGRKAYFKSYGYDTMIIGSSELNPERTIKKIVEWDDEFFRKVGKNVKIYPTAKLVNIRNLEIADNVTIGDFVFLNAGNNCLIGHNSQLNAGAVVAGGGELIIEQNVVVSYGTVILTGTDTPRGLFMCDAMPESLREVIRGKIMICDNAFIGANVVVTICKKRPTITIGESSIIGSQTYIDKDVFPQTFVYSDQNLIFRRRIL